MPEDLRPDHVAIREPPRAALLRAGFVEEFDRLDLIRSAEPGWRPPAPSRGSAGAGSEARPGRGPLHLIDLAGAGQAVVRPFRRGGLVRRLVEARYFLGDRAFHELVLLARLRRRGVPVPRPLAAVQSDRVVGYRAALVTRRIPGVAPLSRLLRRESPGGVERLMASAGETVARLHEAGGWHADLNAHNLLADPDDPERPVHLVDLDRGRLGDGPVEPGPARRNLRRLHRSLEKLSLREALDYWDSLERAYSRNREATAGGSAG